MAYSSGTATDLADLMSKLFTFAVAQGWTQDQLSTGTGQAALHKNNVYVSFRWNTTTPQPMGIYQALGYTGGNQPGQHPNDSGSGSVTSTNATLLQERCVDEINNGPFPHYAFFANTTYIHVAVETSTDHFRHFGFGELQKFGTWTGGEYAYGQTQDINSPVNNANCALLDGLHSDASANNEDRNATLHCEGLTGQAGAGKWGTVWGGTTTPNVDTAGNAKVIIQGGYRGGPIAKNYGWIAAGAQSGLIPTYPIGCWYRNPATSFLYFLGYQPDVRGVNIGAFAPKDEVTIGSDVWKFYPLAFKTSTNVTDRTFNSGIAYRKVP